MVRPAGQNPQVRSGSLPQVIPPPTLPIATMNAQGELIMNQTWYLFFYSVGQQVLPYNGGSSLVAAEIAALQAAVSAIVSLTLPNLTHVLNEYSDGPTPPSPAGTPWWDGQSFAKS